MATIFSIADQFKRDLLRSDRGSAMEIVRAYGEIWARLKTKIDSLTAKIESARANGVTVSQSWLIQGDRLQSLLRQVESEIAGFSQFAAGKITVQQLQAVHNGAISTNAMISEGLKNRDAEILSSFSRLNSQAVQAIVGFATDGSPLTDLLKTMVPEASTAVRSALVQGVALGYNPAKIARQIRDELGGSLTRALTIGRTETLRAYRESSFQTYQDNDDVLDGWTWVAALGPRTCAMCIAMHGTIHKPSERMYSHPNCRCVMVPLIKGRTGPSIQSGSTWFNNADEATQLHILGASAFDAFQSGKISLEDLIGTSDSARWGPSRFVLSLSQALGQAQKPGRKAA